MPCSSQLILCAALARVQDLHPGERQVDLLVSGGRFRRVRHVLPTPCQTGCGSSKSLLLESVGCGWPSHATSRRAVSAHPLCLPEPSLLDASSRDRIASTDSRQAFNRSWLLEPENNQCARWNVNASPPNQGETVYFPSATPGWKASFRHSAKHSAERGSTANGTG